MPGGEATQDEAYPGRVADQGGWVQGQRLSKGPTSFNFEGFLDCPLMRPHRLLRPALWLALSVLLGRAAAGLIVYDSASSTNNTFNTSAPGAGSAGDGAPWSHVAQQRLNSIIDSSAVYLGNGFVITAAHTFDPTAVVIDGANYTRDTSFAPISFSPIDLRLYRLLTSPPLGLLPCISKNETDTTKTCVMIGWGKGKGAVINEVGAMGNKGWQWGGTLGDDVSKDKRWGTNTSNGSAETVSYSVGAGNYSYTGISVFFNSSGGANEATGTLGDSGGGMFVNFNGTWKLAGTAGAVYTSGNYANGASLYSPSASKTVFVRFREIVDLFRFKQWKEARSIPVASADTLDPDKDGIGILAEYAQGFEPTVNESGLLPVATVSGSNATLTYQLRASATDLTVALEESTDLTGWSLANGTSTQVLSTNGTIRKFKATVPLNGAARKYLRLKFTRLE